MVDANKLVDANYFHVNKRQKKELKKNRHFDVLRETIIQTISRYDYSIYIANLLKKTMLIAPNNTKKSIPSLIDKIRNKILTEANKLTII